MVFPTQVGVFPLCKPLSLFIWRLPHAGGGVSEEITADNLVMESSPRRWGCFDTVEKLSNFYFVFPTQVGVFLEAQPEAVRCVSLPHAGGGVSLHYFN